MLEAGAESEVINASKSFDEFLARGAVDVGPERESISESSSLPCPPRAGEAAVGCVRKAGCAFTPPEPRSAISESSSSAAGLGAAAFLLDGGGGFLEGLPRSAMSESRSSEAEGFGALEGRAGWGPEFFAAAGLAGAPPRSAIKESKSSAGLGAAVFLGAGEAPRSAINESKSSAGFAATGLALDGRAGCGDCLGAAAAAGLAAGLLPPRSFKSESRSSAGGAAF